MPVRFFLTNGSFDPDFFHGVRCTCPRPPHPPWFCTVDARDRGRGGARAVPRHVVRGDLGRHRRHHRQDEVNYTHTHTRATRPFDGWLLCCARVRKVFPRCRCRRKRCRHCCFLSYWGDAAAPATTPNPKEKVLFCVCFGHTSVYRVGC